MKRKGFTLIELMIVVAIVGIIATIIVPPLFGVKRNSGSSFEQAVQTEEQLRITELEDELEECRDGN